MYDDKELQEYRDLLEVPEHFEEGFDWKTIVGAIFIGFLMMPGSMYLQLVIGTGIGPAARWVTIILFAELAKRSYTELKQQEIFPLSGAALEPISGPVGCSQDVGTHRIHPWVGGTAYRF
jgi:hypothetical protein